MTFTAHNGNFVHGACILWLIFILLYRCIRKTRVFVFALRSLTRCFNFTCGLTCYLYYSSRFIWQCKRAFRILTLRLVLLSTAMAYRLYMFAIYPTVYRWYRRRMLTQRTNCDYLPPVLWHLIWEYCEPGPSYSGSRNFAWKHITTGPYLGLTHYHRVRPDGVVASVVTGKVLTDRWFKPVRVRKHEFIGLGSNFILLFYQHTHTAKVIHLDCQPLCRKPRILCRNLQCKPILVDADTVCYRIPNTYMVAVRQLNSPNHWRHYKFPFEWSKLHISRGMQIAHSLISGTQHWGRMSLQTRTKSNTLVITDELTGKNIFFSLPTCLHKHELVKDTILHSGGFLELKLYNCTPLTLGLVRRYSMWFELQYT